MKTLETERLVLRTWQEFDAFDMFEYAKNPNVGSKAGWKPHESESESLGIIKGFIEKDDCWAIELKENNKVIGSVGIHKTERYEGYKMLGYALSEDYWGKGIIPEAIKQVIDYLFSETDLRVLTVYHFPFNAASKRVIEKCGFTYEGTFRQDYKAYNGEIYDSVGYSMLKEEWEVRKEIEYYNSLPFVFNGFVDTSGLTNGKIELKCIATHEADPVKKWVPDYVFDVCKDGKRVGEISLRIGYTESLYYGGQIGYAIDEQYRGNGYAAAACRLLVPVMKAHEMIKVLICNDQNNIASKRVCEKLGARFVRMAKLPEWHDLYKLGNRYYENIFEWTISENN